MLRRIWLFVLLLGLSAVAGYAGDTEKAQLCAEKCVQLLEYRTQFSNVGTPAGRIIKVQAGKQWQRTGIVLHKGDSVIISYLRGKWSANLEQGMYDANGCPGAVADNESYVMRMVNEGALCGKMGKDGAPFFIGNTQEIVVEEKGELFLIINDDITQKLGVGYADNRGHLDIVIYAVQDEGYR